MSDTMGRRKYFFRDYIYIHKPIKQSINTQTNNIQVGLSDWDRFYAALRTFQQVHTHTHTHTHTYIYISNTQTPSHSYWTRWSSFFLGRVTYSIYMYINTEQNLSYTYIHIINNENIMY